MCVLGRWGVLQGRGSGVNMINDDLCSGNIYIPFCVKHSELGHVMDIIPQKCYVLLLTRPTNSVQTRGITQEVRKVSLPN